jgi:hypothetical protein
MLNSLPSPPDGPDPGVARMLALLKFPEFGADLA